MSRRRERRPSPLGAALRNFWQDSALDLAAMVAFYALLALAPLLYLVGLSLSWVLRDSAALEAAVERLVVFVPPSVAGVLRAVAADLPGEGLVVLAIPGLVWVASSALSALEYSVNVAFGTAPQRRIWHSRLKALVVLGTGWLVLGASLVAATMLPHLDRLRQQVGLPPAPGQLTSWASQLSLLALSFGAFVLFYRLLPRGRVRWRAAAAGAVLALVLWEVGRRLFATVLVRSPSFDLLTGAAAGLAAFLIWTYTSVAITLLGAEYAAVLNGNREAPGRRTDRPA